ncbi:MAG: PhzF family phenazine biosynthesis protein, partial [Acidobacteria bacterium]|nr:PhzF family phenazine biosynthesis protein [Acidobacteriota bacterium]
TGEVEEAGDLAELARGLGLSIEELDESLPVQAASTGVPMLLAPVRSLEALGRCRMNASVLSEVCDRTGVQACYAFTRETFEGGASRAHARLFAPDFGFSEDPATGGAAGPLASYLIYHGALEIEAAGDGAFNFVIEQGDFIHRPSRIQAEIKGSRGRIEQTRVGGSSVVVAHGELVF